MLVLETQRLNLRWLNNRDAEFILDLLNQPSWLEFIGERGVHDLKAAKAYINDGPLEMIRQHGFGLYLVEKKADGHAIGLCGLLKRETLDDIDIGFAFHPDFWGRGYAREAAASCLEYAQQKLGLDRVVAVTMPANQASIALLKAIGMQYQQNISLGGSEEILQLFSKNLR